MSTLQHMTTRNCVCIAQELHTFNNHQNLVDDGFAIRIAMQTTLRFDASLCANSSNFHIMVFATFKFLSLQCTLHAVYYKRN